MTELGHEAEREGGQDTGHGGPFDHEIEVRVIAKVGLWLAVTFVAAGLVTWGFYRWLAASEKKLDRPPSPVAAANEPRPVPGPLLQPAPEIDLRGLRAEEAARLAGWGWSDRTLGAAHVPVERAIEDVAAAGALPDFSAPPEGVAPPEGAAQP
jgi:hypothetical protein